MSKFNGITVTLYEKTVQENTDGFGMPTYKETAAEVHDVLIGEPSAEDVINELQLSGKHLAYTLAIPKGDTHIWTDRRVDFFGQSFKTFGEVTQGIEANIPLRWNKKVKVERYG